MHRDVVSRRQMLLRCSNGFGAVALAGLMARDQSSADVRQNPFAPRQPHFRPRAKSVIFLYMSGGPSQMDTFDPKPRLTRDHGQPMPIRVEPTQFNNIGRIMQSPFRFQRYGQSGIPVSEIFPHVATCVDDLAIIRSMTANFSEHTNANYFLHSGHGQQGRPSMGAWITYGLGSECDNLPGYIVLETSQIPPGGLDIFSNGFLPASNQASLFRRGDSPVADLRGSAGPDAQQRKMDLMRRLDRAALERSGPSDPIEAAIGNYELAFQMQTAVPELMDLSRESRATKQLYGLDDRQGQGEGFGNVCLLARRLVERGVRFVELISTPNGFERWDNHRNIRRDHVIAARSVDKAIAGLLKDLKARGLLEQTLVVWGGEFGRTPMSEGSEGRDHHPFGFTMWMAGGGVKGGTIYGGTDEFGYHAVENPLEMHDLHATMLHLLGMDHTRLTYRFGGRDMRLTDVHGNVVHGIIA